MSVNRGVLFSHDSGAKVFVLNLSKHSDLSIDHLFSKYAVKLLFFRCVDFKGTFCSILPID